MGRKEQAGVLYILDFGLSTRFKEVAFRRQMTVRKYRSLVGTARFASVNAHKGLEQCRADDLESFAYMMIYMAKGQLPWEKIKAESQMERYEIIKEKKTKLTPAEICVGLPSILIALFTTCCR